MQAPRLREAPPNKIARHCPGPNCPFFEGGQLGPGQLGPGAQLSGAQLSIFWGMLGFSKIQETP